jgi:transposase
MSTTSKSPKKVAAAAYHVARETLPEHSHRYSPRKYTQPQLLVCLVLKVFFKTEYRGIVEILNDWPDLCQVFGLKTIPHFTTLQKASKRLLRFGTAERLLNSTIETIEPDRHVALAAIDSTGLESRHISRYFVSRRRSKEREIRDNIYRRRWPKLAIICDCRNHAILSAITTRGPSVDVNQFCKTLQPATEKVRMDCVLADAGYDSEANHRYARQCHHIETMIPAKLGRPTTKLPSGPYRRRMRTHFNRELYGQRWQVETAFSMIKRNYGSALRAKHYWSQCREMLLLVLTHNIAIILRLKELFYRACAPGFH